MDDLALEPDIKSTGKSKKGIIGGSYCWVITRGQSGDDPHRAQEEHH
ncbi:hypothetical protein L195_g020425, partial [Trifolium pratense]